jgi:quinol monooxygenase YgiN
MSQQINVLAIATAVRGAEHRLRALQEILVADTVKEPGCLRYELNQSLDDGRILVFVESWASEAAWRAHMQGAAIKRFQMNGGPDLIADFQLHRLTPVANGRSNKAA